MIEKTEWYSNKDLFEMIQKFQNEVIDLREEMKKTTTLIRDYNGLRGTINDVDKRLTKTEQTIIENKDNNKTERQSKSHYVAWVFAFLMFLMTVLQYMKG